MPEEARLARMAARSSAPARRRPNEGSGPSDDRIRALQHAAGNRAVTALLAGAQAKTEVGAVDDPLEREADHVAHQVVDALLGASPGGHTHGGTSSAPGAASTAQRAAVGAAGGSLDEETDRLLGAAGGGGVPLASDLQRSVGDTMGADLGGVRLHSGPEAAELNRRMQAHAFTVGSDVYFRDGMPDTSRPAGLELLSHELAHTVQQGASPSVRRRHAEQPMVQRAFGDDFNWAGAGSMTRSGAGAEGVLFVTSAARNIVVKFLKSGAGADQADRMLRDVGVAVPDSRVVPNTDRDPFAREIRATVNAHLWSLGDTQQVQVTTQMETYGYIQVQDMAAATPVGSLQVNDVRTFLSNAGLLQEVGRIAAVDSFLGNTDRLSQKHVNTGNYLVRDSPAGPTLIAIDNEIHAAFASDKTVREHEVRFIVSDTGADTVATALLGRMTNMWQLFAPTDQEMAFVKDNVRIGIRQGAEDLIRVMGAQPGFIDGAKQAEKQMPGPGGSGTKQRTIVRKTLEARAEAMRSQLAKGELKPAVPAV